MKKISLYIMTLLAVLFASCNEDFSTLFGPQSNPQESALQSSSVTYTSADVRTINLSLRAEEGIIVDDSPITLGTVTVAEGAMPANTIMKAKVDISKQADFAEFVTIDAESMANTNEVNVLPSNLQAAYYNSFTHSPNETPLYIRISLYTVTDGTSEAMVGNPENADFYKVNPEVAFTPVNEKGIYISTAYYAVVKDLNGNWVEKKFSHSEVDVYDDPIFTVSIDALKNEAGVRLNTVYYIVAEEDLAAFKGGNLSVGFGQGEGEGIVQGGPAFVGPATDGAAKYNLTLNMEKLALVIEPEVHFYCYYLLGSGNMKIGTGDSHRRYMYYKVDETTFSYTTYYPDNSTGKSWLSVKVWEREAMNAGDEGKAWGYSGTGTAVRPESGGLKLTGLAVGPQTKGWYTMTITMDEEKNIHKYSFASIAAPSHEYTNISIIGTINGSNWDKDFELTQCAKAPHNWCMLDFELTADAKLKFRANKNWETKDWGGDGSQPISNVVYTLPKGSSDITVPAGKYDFYLNDITGDWTILKVTE